MVNTNILYEYTVFVQQDKSNISEAQTAALANLPL